MLAICIILLGSIAYPAYGQDNLFQCYKRLNEECPKNIPTGVPDTVSKLQESCSMVIEHLSCDLKVREECDPLGNVTRLVQEVYKYILSICDENSLTYKVVSENIGCLASSVEQIEHYCYTSRSESGDLQLIRENAEAHVGDIESLSLRDLHCIDDLMTITCGSLMAGTRCGDEVEDVLFDVADNLIRRVEPCSPDLTSVRGTLRTVFRDAFMAEETFASNMGAEIAENA